jgi:hypothetical protein
VRKEEEEGEQPWQTIFKELSIDLEKFPVAAVQGQWI